MEHHVAGSKIDPRDGFIKVERASISGGLCRQDRFDLQERHRYSSTELTPPAQQFFTTQFFRFRVTSCKEKIANGGQGLPRGWIYVMARRCARPQGTLCQV